MWELFLHGVPEYLVRHALDRAGGNQLASGKFANPESSAALAANGCGWHFERLALLPAFPGFDDIDWPAVSVEIERQMRFPWSADANLSDSCRTSPLAMTTVRATPALAFGSRLRFSLWSAACLAHQPSGGLGISCFLQIL